MAEVTFKTPLTDSYASFTLEECSQFSLDDDDEHQTRATNRQKHGDKGEIEPLTDRRQSSSNQTSTNGLQRNNDNKRTPRTQENKRNGREASRLTDEVELDDGNSDSDDLDLLPPLPTSTSKTNERKRKLKRLVQCCSPYYVPAKMYNYVEVFDV
ncbi:hypothetical protein M3Y97_00397600 [Aphelenchoides bicaudatus]|nr:hypothetical protein M3Y97_00397600 [Aphelenchoides bicaudatus]